MRRKVMLLMGLVVALVAAAASIPWVGAGASPKIASGSKHEPVLDPANFVSVIDNPYYPLPVGRTLVYRGVRNGKTQVDRVHVTKRTKVVEGISATVVTDVATHRGTLLEKTEDWFAQDKQGNVWYLGEDTKAYLPNGHVDTSGTWTASVQDAEPGIVMEAHPQVPDAYRQEYLRGQAEDTAWIVGRGGSVKVPYGSIHRAIRTLEFTQLEPDVVDTKYYAPCIGIVSERTLAGGGEIAELVAVKTG